MGLAFAAFGGGTINLVMVLKANVDLLTSYGWQAVMDGGLRQLLEIVVTGYLSMAAYVIFKACEHVLVDDIAEGAGPPRHDDEP